MPQSEPYGAEGMSTAKRQKLSALSGLGGVSDAALARILQSLHAEPLDGNISRQAINRASGSSIADARATIRLPTDDGGVFEWTYLQAHVVLTEAVRSSQGLTTAVEEAWARRPCSFEEPWSLVMYFDELTPGNVLRPQNNRKVMAVYVGIRELGPHVLCKTEAWVTLAMVRASTIKRVEGGWSRMLRDLLRSMFLGAQGLSSAGILVELSDGPRLLFLRLSNMLADEAALKMALDCKGASGLRPCPICKNLVASGSDLARRDDTGYLVDLGSPDHRRCDFASDAEIWEIADLLQAAKPEKTARQFAELQQSAGFNHNPVGVLSDPQLRAHFLPSSITTFDAMHCIFANGTASVEAFLFLRQCRTELGIRYADLKAFCGATWEFPENLRAKGRALPEVFSQGREQASTDTFKAGATEVLMTMPLLCHFAERVVVPSGKLKAELRSLFAQGEVVSAVLGAKRARTYDATVLSAAVDKHLRLFVRAYGAEYVKPKHHYATHLGRQARRDGVILDAFTVERKHYAGKRAAEHVDNTRDFEASVLSRMHVAERRALQDADFRDCLESPTAPGFGLTLSARATCMAMQYAVNDVVFVHGVAAFVCACCTIPSGTVGALVRKMALERQNVTSSLWRRLPDIELVDGRDMQLASCWSVQGEQFEVLR